MTQMKEMSLLTTWFLYENWREGSGGICATQALRTKTVGKTGADRVYGSRMHAQCEIQG